MRYTDRTLIPAPISLSRKGGRGCRERARAHEHFSREDLDAGDMFTFAAYKGRDVKEALEKLFHGKCAYCESRYGAVMPMHVEHYRPKGGVTEDSSHPGYWWLASSWDNLLPSCAHCNGTEYHFVQMHQDEAPYGDSMSTGCGRYLLGKLNQFPVESFRASKPEDNLLAETPRLINPTAMDPALHLVWVTSNDLSLVGAKVTNGTPDLCGFTTYRVFGLNRQKLVEERTALSRRISMELQDIEEQLDDVVLMPSGELRSRAIERVIRKVASIRECAQPDRPYSMMAESQIDSRILDFEKRLLGFLSPPPCSQAQVPSAD